MVASGDWKSVGWARLGQLAPQPLLAELAGEMEAAGVVGPSRAVLSLAPSARQVARSEAVLQAATDLLEGQPRLVRALWFDKVPDRNWPVLWHQDKHICVAERHEVHGFEAWSVKGGIAHVEPPLEVLQRMATIRIHVDACRPNNGPLRIIAATHTSKMSPEQIETAVASGVMEDVLAGEGHAIAMRPLLLHSSKRAEAPDHRRVLHLEFASDDLPAPLAWRELSSDH